MQNQIPKNWQNVKMGDILTESPQYGYTASSTKSKLGPKLLRITDIQNDFVDWENVPYCEISEKEKSKYLLETGDIVFARTGNTTGANFYLNNMPREEAVFASYLIRVTPDKKKCLPKYLAYFFRSRSYWGQVKNLLSGSAQPGINASNLQNLTFDLPEDIETQKEIVSILSVFDDKIEINNKVARTLEETAQALFKEWFVHFRFPGYEKAEFVDSELGRIPRGWSIGILNNFIGELESGKRPKGGVSTYTVGVPSIGAENIDGLDNSNFSNIKLIPENFFDAMNMGKIKDYDILIYKDGGVPGIFKVKFTIIGQGYPFLKAAINEHVFRLQANKLERQFYLYFYLNLRKSIKYFESVGGKAAVPGINSTDFKNLPLLIPNDDIIQLFDKLVSPMIKKILNAKLQNQKLATLRDLLLPKLMKGEIKVN